MRFLSSIFLALSLFGCSPVDVINEVVPSKGYAIKKDIAYGPARMQKLDLYIPEHPKDDAAVIVFIHGGSWQSGDRKDYLFAGQGLVSLGYYVAVVDYRLYPEVKYPDFLDDNAKALVWVYNNINRYGGNGENLYVMGHSAGAYNAAMLALEPSYLQKAGGNVGWLRGVIGLSGPYDFLPFTDAKIIDIFSTEKDLRKTQPIDYVHAKAPPFLLMTGTSDDTVSPKNSEKLAQKLKSLGEDVTFKTYEGVGHKTIMLGLATPLMWNEEVRSDIKSFVESH